MNCKLLDGTAIAAEIRASAIPGVQAFTARAGRAPDDYLRVYEDLLA